MDKVLAKQVTGAQAIKSVPYVWFTKQQWTKSQDDYLKQINRLTLPLFVKPVHLGSSIGITKVTSRDELLNAIEVALHYDDKVIVEQGVQDLTEVTVPVMGNDNPRAALVEESLAKADFFNFEDKYIGQGKKANGGTGQYSNLPAKISKKLYDQAEALALASYKAIGAQGTARIDLLIDNKDGQIYLNEINTLPGSLYVHNWKQAGVSPIELVTELIELAEEAHKKRQSVELTFDSKILKEAYGSKFSG
jgi:D-alanine-D-alanine ligase